MVTGVCAQHTACKLLGIYIYIYIYIQGDSLARGPKQIWKKYSRIWRNAFKCAWM